MNEYGKEVKKQMDTYMNNEDSIDKEVSDIQNAMHGVEVRGALAAGVKKSFDKSKESETKANEAHDVMESIINEGFDNAALEANFEQKLDEEIANLQPEWTQFKDQTNQQLADIASNVKTLGAIGDGIADDTIYIEEVLNTINPYLPRGIYRITRPITISTDKDFRLLGDNAIIEFDSLEDASHVIGVNCLTGINIILEGVKINGNKKVNKIFEVTNNRDSMTNENLTNLQVKDVTVTGAKKIKEFLGDGSGIYARGAFDNIILDSVSIIDCELPFGEGTSGSVGVTGATFTHFGENAYPKNVIVKNSSIEKVYSSDSGYTVDQDGIKHIAPLGLPSRFISENMVYINCYGRSIKTQTFETILNNTEVIIDDIGCRGSISAQYGNLNIDTLKTIQRNGVLNPRSLVGIGSHPDLGRPYLNIKRMVNIIENGSELSVVVDTLPREGYIGNVTVEDVVTIGDIREFMAYRINGDSNNVLLKNIDVENFSGEDKALISVGSSGNDSPYRANVVVVDCVYNGPDKPNIMRDQISGIAARGDISTINNVGFSEVGQMLTVNTLTPTNRLAVHGVESIIIMPNEVETFNFSIYDGAMIDLSASINHLSFAKLYAHRGGLSEISVGSRVTTSFNEEPEGSYIRVWFENNKMLVRNMTSNNVKVTVSFIANRYA